MTPRTTAIRAISSVYVLEVMRPLFRIAGIVLALIACATLYAAIRVSAWWLILLLPLSFLGIVLLIVSILATAIARLAAPTMTPAQHTDAQNYVTNFHEVTGTLQTGQFMVAIKILIDIYKRRWQGGFIQQTTEKSVRLKKDFEALSDSFK